jgi:hypothetical protein
MAGLLDGESDHWQIVLIIVEDNGSLVLVAEPTRQCVPCPKCGEPSRRQHSSYLRLPLDLPWRGHMVRLRLRSRRWFCDVPDCPREIFAERFDGVLAHYARRTHDTTELLTFFALQAGGEGGARLARKAGDPLALMHCSTCCTPLLTMVDSVVRGFWVLMTLLSEKNNAGMGRCCSIWKRTNPLTSSTTAPPRFSPIGCELTPALRSSSAIELVRMPKADARAHRTGHPGRR